MECGGGSTSGVCDVDDEGTSINCPAGICVKAECSQDGVTVIFRTCGVPTNMEAGIDTKTSECQDGVFMNF